MLEESRLVCGPLELQRVLVPCLLRSQPLLVLRAHRTQLRARARAPILVPRLRLSLGALELTAQVRGRSLVPAALRLRRLALRLHRLLEPLACGICFLASGRIACSRLPRGHRRRRG